MFKTGIDENCLKCPDLGCLFTTYLWQVGCINKTKFAIKKKKEKIRRQNTDRIWLSKNMMNS